MSKQIIEPIERYELDGKEYRSLKDIRSRAEDELGMIIDQVEPHLPAKQALQLLKIITEKKNREVLLRWLDMVVEREVHDAPFGQTERTNIFDMDLGK